MQTLNELIKKADFYREKRALVLPLEKEEQNSLEEYLQINFIYSSNALDGSTLTVTDTKKLLKEGTPNEEKLQKAWNEIIGHRKAYDFMLDLALQQDINISEEIIKKLHQHIYDMLDAEQAGQYRQTSVKIPGADYDPTAPEDILQVMGHIIDQILSSRTTLHPIELAAMTHKRLLDIHPFKDGNGKIARLLMNLILVHAGYGVTIILPIRQNDYNKALSASRQSNDMEPFSKFIAECVIESEKEHCQMLNSNP